MAGVINSEHVEQHNINKYKFKVLTSGSDESKDEVVESILVEQTIKEEESTNKDTDIDSSAMSQSSKDSLIESLMKKTDDMSSNFIKLQMKLESMTEEHKKEIDSVKEESFAQGVEAGKKQADEDAKASMENGVEQFSSSVVKLENAAKEFESALEGIKKELISAALDISKEVVNVELNENSTEIATLLSNELIKELQNASKVTLKVNPKDHGALSEKIGSLEHVEIVSDSAVNQGGVIAISDAGNIDAQISKRFERVKRAALSE